EAVKAAVLAATAEFRAERHAVTGLVPIWEVRQEIGRRFGDEAARHDIFDELVLQLWREGKARLTAISDLSKATPQQLQGAIPGSGNTLFYIEAAHELAPA